MSQKRTKNEPKRTKNEPQRTIFRKSKYECICCDYVTFKKANYTRHMNSKKHIKCFENSKLKPADISTIKKKTKKTLNILCSFYFSNHYRGISASKAK